MFRFLIFIFIITVLGESCKSQSVLKDTYLEALDSARASEMIILEDADVYFERLQPLEVSIQMNREIAFSSKKEAVDSLKIWLKTQVLDFTPDDKVFIDSVFTEAKKRVRALNPSLMPDTIRLIKIKPDPYGEKVYFTRLKTIYFPKSAFQTYDFETELKVLVHELWHVISRLNLSLRDQTYPLIGFEKHGKQLRFPEVLTKKLITNPDAAFHDYAIDLNGTLAIPLLTSRLPAYRKEIPYFFDYIDFNLYPIAPDQTVGIQGILDERTDIFFQKIKDNTNYIIHPEEIIADNFQLLVYANYSDNYKGFSSEGKALLLQLKEVLVNW